MKLTPFEIASIINDKKGRIDIDECGYDPYVINRVFSNTRDTVLFANEMNANARIPKQMQFDFYYYSLPKQKRYGKWFKTVYDKEKIDLIKEYTGFSFDKAKDLLSILEPHLDEIREELNKGGLQNGKQRKSD